MIVPRDAPEVELRDIVLLRGDHLVLDGLSATFPAGTTTVLLGPAGSGKSMVLKTAAGLAVFDSGSVSVGGQDLSLLGHREEREFQRYSGFLFQDGALWANQTVHDNIGLPLAVHEARQPISRRERRIVDIARSVGYCGELSLRPAALSTGEQKLVSLARALVLDPPLVFLDEPTASLDDASSERVVALVSELKKRGRTIVIVSRDTRLIAETADFLCVVTAGKVTVSGPARDVAASIGGSLHRALRARNSGGSSSDGGSADRGGAGTGSGLPDTDRSGAGEVDSAPGRT